MLPTRTHATATVDATTNATPSICDHKRRGPIGIRHLHRARDTKNKQTCQHTKKTNIQTNKHANCDKRLEADIVNKRAPLRRQQAQARLSAAGCMFHPRTLRVVCCGLARRCVVASTASSCCPCCTCRAFEAEASKHVARLGKPVCPWLHDNAAMPRCNGSTCSKMGTAASGAAGALLRPDPHCTTEY